MDEWAKKMCHIHTVEHYSAIKREINIAICYNMDEMWGHYAEGNNSHRKRNITQFHLCKLYKALTRMVLARACKEGENGEFEFSGCRVVVIQDDKFLEICSSTLCLSLIIPCANCHWISSLVMYYLFMYFVHFFIGLFFFWLLSSESLLYSLDMSPLPYMCLQITFPSVCLVFLFSLTVFFEEQKLLEVRINDQTLS